MFAIGPILLEVFFVLLKPQELYEFLLAFQPLYTIPGMIALGFVFDAGRYGLGANGMKPAPYLYHAIFFFLWCLFTIMVRAPATLTAEAILFGTSVLMAMSIAHCVQTLTLYKIFGAFILSITLLLSFIASHQARAPFKCFWLDPVDRTVQHYDGHPCGGVFEEAQCYREDDEHERTYVCEHAGLMGTASVAGRVRFRGNLEDPNELSLTCAIGFPFAVAFFAMKKTVVRAILVAVSFVLIGSCVFYSQSRGGQLVLMAVLATLFIKRFGWKVGGVVGGIAAVPMLILATMTGRSESEAEGSALERIECLQIGLELVKRFPLIGVGKGQFGEYHFLTAHNSYVLAAAETGLIGFAVWSCVIYLGVKIPLSCLKALKDKEGKKFDEARHLSTALLASMIGLVLGSYFLSFSFHAILWIYVGLTGALAGLVRKLVPEYRVGISGKELGAIVGANVTLLTVIFLYAKYKIG